MWDLGDTVALGCQFKNSSGVLTDTTVVLTITLPDGTTTAPTPVHASTGIYTAGYVPIQSGRHFVRWVGTGAVVAAFTDVFDVHSVTGAPQMFSLDEARAALREPSGSTTDDEALRGYIATATRVIEDVWGPVLSRTVVQTFDGGVRTLFLDDPITSIVSVTESGSAKTAGVDYTPDLESGFLTRGVFYEPGSYSSVWAPGLQNIVVTYKVGIATGQVVPEYLRTAGRIILRWLWQSDQTGLRPQFGAPDTSLTPSGLEIPKAALMLLQGTSTSVGTGWA